MGCQMWWIRGPKGAPKWGGIEGAIEGACIQDFIAAIRIPSWISPQIPLLRGPIGGLSEDPFMALHHPISPVWPLRPSGGGARGVAIRGAILDRIRDCVLQMHPL